MDISVLLRFLAVGGSLSLLYSGVTSGLISGFGTPPLMTSILVYASTIPLGFWAQKTLAFQQPKTGRAAFWGYVATQIASIITVSTITTRFVTRDFFWDSLVFLVTAATAAIASFLICRFIIFREST